MRVRCDKCYRVYDDAVFITICPHDIGVGGGKYCRFHDLFDCTFSHDDDDEPPLAAVLPDGPGPAPIGGEMTDEESTRLYQ